MNRFWLGVGILAVLLISSLIPGSLLIRQNKALSVQLSDAAQQALEENWQEAIILSEQASRQWKKHRHFAAALTDHEPLEEMDRMFAQLQIYQHCRMKTEYAALCTLLSRQAEAMGESVRLTWWSFW